MSIYKKTGALLFGTRLKRLSDQFLSDLSAIYKNEDIYFEASWFPVFYLLDTRQDVTISSIARQLEITHSGASQMVTSLKKKGFVQISQVCEDKRLKTVSFTSKGYKKLKEIKPIWYALQESMDDLLSSKADHFRILDLLEALEEDMARINLVEAVQERLQFNQFLERIEVIPYREEMHDPFMSLVLKWLSENPDTIPREIGWINHTQQEVVARGNTLIFMAVHSGEILSACAATLDSLNSCAEISFVFEQSRVSNHLIQVLMDKVIGELEEKDVENITTKASLAHSNVLKILQKNGFKLMEIEKNSVRNNTCTYLSRKLINEEEI